MMTSSFRVAVGLVLLIALFVTVSATPGLQAEDEKVKTAKATDAAKKAKPAAPETEEAKVKPIKVDISSTGIFDSAGHAKLVLKPEEWGSFKVESAAKHGTMVREGESILRFQTKDFKEKVDSSTLSFELSKLSLKLADESVKTLEVTTPLDLADAEESALHTEDDYQYFKKVTEPMAIKMEEFQLKSSIQRLEAAEEELNQLQKMYDADDLTEETEEIVLKRAKQSVEVARFFNEMAQLSHDRSIETTLPRRSKREKLSLERALLRRDRSRLTLPVNLKEKKISLAKQQVAYNKMKKELDDLKADRKLLEVSAPKEGLLFYGDVIDGKLSTAAAYKKLLVEDGTIPAKKVFMTIVDPQNLFVRLTIKEDQLHLVKEGQWVKITPTAFPDMRINGAISSVTRIPNASGAYSAEISIEEDELKKIDANQIVPTMTCKLKVQAYLNKEAITLPSTVVFRDELNEDERFVYLPAASKDEKPKKQIVKVGKTSGKLIEILEGLEAGQKVLKKKP